MSRKCDLCGKHTVFGNKVSHAKNHSRRSWRPNLVNVKTKLDGTVQTIKVCTRCLKAGKVLKHIA
jgi:large subunit ribosomal protein L28